jgi:hypothetical protein
MIMKKLLGISLAVFLCLGIASTSMAGVWTCKGVMIFSKAFLCTNTAAESDAISMQGNIGTADVSCYYGCRRWIDYPESYSAVRGSVTGNAGIAGLNSASGNLNNQANTVAATLTAGYQGSLAHSVAFAFQANIINVYFSMKKQVAAGIFGSANDNLGVAGVNNAAGSQNNQANTVAIAAGLNTQIALSEAYLAQANAIGIVITVGGANKAMVARSVNNNHGVVGVNNSAGAQNNQANVVAIAGTHS